MKKISLVLVSICLLVFGMANVAQADLILFEGFNDSSGFTIGGGSASYWGIAPLAGTASIPSNFTQGDSQFGDIFYGAGAKDFSNLTLRSEMTIALPDLTGYSNLELIVSLSAAEGVWEYTHRDSLHIINGTTGGVCSSGAGCLPTAGVVIDSFLPLTYADSLKSSVYSIDLVSQFNDFKYSIDSSLQYLTFGFSSTANNEHIGIDSVKITGNAVPEPLTIFLLGFGIVGAFIKRRRA